MKLRPNNRIGFMSYTKDPSLRRHTFGAVEPMTYNYERRSLWPTRLITFLGIIGAIALWVLYA